MSAILLPVILILAGLVTDIGRAFTYKAEINRACMVSAEEAAKEINIDIAQHQGFSILNNNYADIINSFFYANILERDNFSIEHLSFEVTDSMSNPKYIRVSAQAKINCFFLKLAGIDQITIHSQGCGRLKKL